MSLIPHYSFLITHYSNSPHWLLRCPPVHLSTCPPVHLYSECECDQLAPLSHKGVISQPFVFNKTARVFFADFPTASPYVTR